MNVLYFRGIRMLTMEQTWLYYRSRLARMSRPSWGKTYLGALQPYAVPVAGKEYFPEAVVLVLIQEQINSLHMKIIEKAAGFEQPERAHGSR